MPFVKTTAQKKISQVKGRFRVIQGGSSASKTYSIIPLLITYAAEVKGLRISIVSESLPHLKKGAMRDFKEIMTAVGNWNENNWNASNYTYLFPKTKSYIEFFSARDGEKLRGSRRDILFVNECNSISFEAWNQLQMRTSLFCYLDFNPSHKFWVHEEIMTDPDAQVLTLTYKDNEATPPALIREFEKWIEKAKTSAYWRNYVNVYVYGKLGVLEHTIFNDWEILDQFPYKEAKLIGYGMDFGYSNDPTVLMARYDWKGKTIRDEVFRGTHMQPQDVVDMLKHHIRFSDRIVADSEDPQQIDYIKNAGFHNIKRAAKPRGSVKFGIGIMQQAQPFYVTARSLGFIKELRNYTWEKDKDGNILYDTPIDAWNHGIDAARYEETYDLLKPQQGTSASQGTKKPRHERRRA